jgi:DNA-binding MarR family transcriptional regulator
MSLLEQLKPGQTIAMPVRSGGRQQAHGKDRTLRLPTFKYSRCGLGPWGRSKVPKRSYDRSDNLRQILLAAARAINQDVTAAIHAAGYPDLKNSEVFCLAHIDLDGTTIVEIAARSNVSKQAISKLVAGLVKLGYLSTSPAKSDGRSIIVQFTARGTELMQRSFALFTKMEQNYSQLVGANNYKAMKRALRRLATRDDPAPPNHLKCY